MAFLHGVQRLSNFNAGFFFKLIFNLTLLFKLSCLQNEWLHSGVWGWAENPWAASHRAGTRQKTIKHHFRYSGVLRVNSGVSLGCHGDLGHESTSSFSEGLMRYHSAAADLEKGVTSYSFHIL